MKECMKLIYHSELQSFSKLDFFKSMFSCSMLLRHTSDINIPVKQNFPPIKEVAKQSGFQLFPPYTQTDELEKTK